MSKLGSEINFHVIRNGVIIRQESKLHNVMSNTAAFFTSQGYDAPSRMYLFDTAIANYASGTFSQTGTTLTRVSGSYDLSTNVGDLIVWPGDIVGGYIVSASASSATMSKSVTIGTNTVKIVNTQTGSTSNGANDDNSSLAIYANFGSLVGGNIVKEFSNPTWSVEVTSSYTLRRITIYQSTGFRHFHYDLPTPLSVVAGDIVVISNFKNIETWSNNFGEIILPASPISGITTSCKYMRMHPTISRETYLTMNRLYMIKTANRYAYPASAPVGATTTTSPAYVNPSVLTSALTLTADVSSYNPATYNNDGTYTATGTFTVNAAQTDIKQFVFGTATQIHGVLEFDTPQTIDFGRVITINQILKVNQTPTY